MSANTSDILARVRRIELRTSKLANDLMVGAYHSQFKGRGMDFEELREYVQIGRASCRERVSLVV